MTFTAVRTLVISPLEVYMAESLSRDQPRSESTRPRPPQSSRREPTTEFPELMHQIDQWDRGLREWYAMGPSHLHALLDAYKSLKVAFAELQALNESLMREQETGSHDTKA